MPAVSDRTCHAVVNNEGELTDRACGSNRPRSEASSLGYLEKGPCSQPSHK